MTVTTSGFRIISRSIPTTISVPSSQACCTALETSSDVMVSASSAYSPSRWKPRARRGRGCLSRVIRKPAQLARAPREGVLSLGYSDVRQQPQDEVRLVLKDLDHGFMANFRHNGSVTLSYDISSARRAARMSDPACIVARNVLPLEQNARGRDKWRWGRSTRRSRSR
jgi:hypothetical protein